MIISIVIVVVVVMVIISSSSIIFFYWLVGVLGCYVFSLSLVVYLNLNLLLYVR